MSDIVQRIGFDVTQGINALNALKSAVNNLTSSLSTLNAAKVGNVSRGISDFAKNLTGVPKTAKNADNALGRLNTAITPRPATETAKVGRALKDVEAQANRTGNSIRQGFAGSFVFTRALSGLRQIIGLLQEATGNAIDFQLAVAEVETIAGGATFDELAQSIRDTSIEFGRTTADTAAAAYQAFSNQVVQTNSELQKFLPTVERIAIATGSSTQDAVNALSSVLNTYGKEAGTAEEISDVLFKTVELGRTRFAEFANALGTVNSIAKESGVTFEEVQAGIASITKTGTTTSVALTQLRGIFTKLLKPTDKLRAAFKSFGAKDGPAFIEASGGILQALQRLDKFSKRTGISIVELFGRARAGIGILNILREEGDDFATTLNELENSAGATLTAFNKIADTDAFKANKAFNQLRTNLDQLGERILPIIGSFAALFNKVIPDSKTLGVLLLGVSAALGVVAIAGAAAVLSLTGLGALLAPVAPILLGIAAAVGIVILAINLQNKAIQASIDLRTKEARLAKEAADKQVEASQEGLKAIEENITFVDGLIEQFFGDQLAEAREFSQQNEQIFNDALQTFADSREQLLKDFAGTIKRIDSQIAASGKRAQSALQQLDDIQFDKSLENLNDSQKAARLLERALKTTAESRRDFANAGNDAEKIRAALDKRREGDRQLRDAARAAARTKEKSDDQAVARAQEKILKDRVKDEANFAKDQKSIQEEIRKNIGKVTDAIIAQQTEVSTLSGKYKELVKSTDEFSQPKDPITLLTDLKEAEQVLVRLFKKLEEDPSGGLFARAGLDRPDRQPKIDVAEATLDFRANAAKSISDFNEILKARPFQARLEFQEAGRAQELKVSTAEAKAKIADLKLDISKTLADQPFVITPEVNFAGLRAAGNQFATKIFGPTGVISDELGPLQQKLTNILSGAGEGFTKDQLARVNRIFDELQTRAIALGKTTESAVTAAAVPGFLERLDEGRKTIDQAALIAEAQADIARGAVDIANVKLDETKQVAQDVATEIGKVATGAVKAKDGTAPLGPNVQKAVTPSGIVATNFERIAAASKQIKPPPTGGGAFFGKTIKRQTGGFTRGQDRILTSTSPGEVVINANAARGIRSQLQAINAQQSPQFRETGGAVTNVGDININIQTPDASSISGRSIARDLKRELRTRTSEL